MRSPQGHIDELVIDKFARGVRRDDRRPFAPHALSFFRVVAETFLVSRISQASAARKLFHAHPAELIYQTGVVILTFGDLFTRFTE